MSDYDFIMWVYERLLYVHKENPSVDFMLKLKEIAEAQSKEE